MPTKIKSIESNLAKEDTISTKNSADRESSPVKRTTDSTCSPRKKVEVQVTINEREILQNNITKKRVTRRSKKKLHLNDRQSSAVNKDEQKAQKNKNKSLDEYDNWHLSSTTSETCVNKENQNSNSNKNKVFSPNHKLTEYFSDLKVRESSDSDVHEDKDLEKKQIDKQDEKQTSSLKSKQPTNSTPLQSVRRPKQHKAKVNIESTNHKVTEYFHVRRSERKYTKNILDEKQKDLENKILRKVEDGLKVTEIDGKGRGVVTTKDFCKGDFVVEYIGDLIDGATAKIREAKYEKNKNVGCYMYYFKFKNTQYCIDATKESGKLGRLINHSRKGNLTSKVIEIDQVPHLILIAKMNIPAGIELLYDYGDRNKESLKNHPWLIL